VAFGAGAQTVRAQLVEATETDPQFERDGFRRKGAGASLGSRLAPCSIYLAADARDIQQTKTKTKKPTYTDCFTKPGKTDLTL